MTESVIHRLKSFFVTAASLWMLAGIHLINRTLRITIDGAEHYNAAKKIHGNVIFAFWHQQTFIPIFLYRHQNACIITINGSRGDVITRVATWLGYQVERLPGPDEGERGTKRMVKFLRLIQKGYDSNIAIDGPAGPAFRARPGIIFLSQRTGFPILPMVVDARPKWVMKNRWDHYFIPFPFARVRLVIGEPFRANPEAPSDEEVKKIQTIMDTLDARV